MDPRTITKEIEDLALFYRVLKHSKASLLCPLVVKAEGKNYGAEKEKIFEGFYRHAEASHHNPKGVGLGLKIVKHIMEAHKGEIKVESQPNKGSTFSLIFPKP